MSIIYWLKFCLRSMAIVSCLLISACSDNPGNEPQNPPTPPEPGKEYTKPMFSFKSLIVSNEGETITCRLQNPDNCPVRCKADWCEVVSSDSSLKITVSPNQSQDARRTANIEFLDDNDKVLSSIFIIQQAVKSSTNVEYQTNIRNSFFPCFTSTDCVFSPEMDITLAAISKRWEETIIPVRIHVKGSSLYTPLSEELSRIYSNTATPTGYFDNSFIVENMIDRNVSIDKFWNQLLSHTSGCSGYPTRYECSRLVCKTHFTSKDEIEASVTIYPYKQGNLRLLVWLIEDGIVAPQLSKYDGEIPNYVHNGILVGSFTPVNGEELEVNGTNPLSFVFKLERPQRSTIANSHVMVVLQRNDDQFNYSDNCWFVDNCLRAKPGKTADTSSIENITEGKEIDH